MSVGLLLRVPSLLHAGLWRDEAYLYAELSAPNFRQFLHDFTVTENLPPLYFLMMYVWTRVAGFSEIALKLPSFVCGLLTIAAVYRLGRVAAGARTGLLAAFLYALTPLAIISSAYARPYSLLALLITLLATSFLQLLATATPRRFIETALLTLLAVYTHPFAMLAVPAFLLFSFVGSGSVKRAAIIAAALLAGAFPYVLWLPIQLAQLSVGLPWLAPASAGAKISYFGLSVLQSIPTESLTAFVLFALLVIVVFRLGSPRSDVAILAGMFLFVLVLEAAAGLSQTRYVYAFYSLFAVFEAWIVIETATILKVKGNFITRSFAIASAAAALIAVITIGGATALASATPHSGIRTLVTARAPGPGDFYIIAPDYMAATFYYYTRDRGAPFMGFARIRNPQIFRAAGYEKLWNDPRALARAECVIDALAGRYRSLTYVADRTARNQWHIPYARTWDLLAFMKAHYLLESTASFSGSEERVSAYTFKAASNSATNPAQVGSFTIHHTMPPLAPLLAICTARAASAAPASSRLKV